ncbi:MAG: hypothetical protein ACE5HB_00260 [Terriglobia bacterium]
MAFWMLIVWLVVTAVVIGLAAYRAAIAVREEDVLYIDPGEERLLKEQAEIGAKLEKLGKLLTYLIIASVVLGLITFGLWVYEALTSPG